MIKKIYIQYMDDESWLIKELSWVKELENIRESQFTLGNGYIGIRGVLEEITPNAIPGTYLAGIYGKTGAIVDDLVNLPNPVNFKLNINGEKLGIDAMYRLQHERILNMKKALLLRHTLYQDIKKRRYDYQSIRFIALNNKHIGVMQIAFTPLDSDCIVEINTEIDTSVHQIRTVSEGERRHFRIKEVGVERNAAYLTIETLEKRHVIVFWTGLYYESNGKKIFPGTNIFSMTIRKSETILFTKIFFIKHFPYKEKHESFKEETLKIFRRIFNGGFTKLIKAHIKAWQKYWQKADILIDADGDVQRNLRFNIYHLLIAGNSDDGFSSIGAKGLSGEGYRGHVFWDAEIFLMPFYIMNFPEIARNMLLYRYRRLDKARKFAQIEGYRGAKFPWESASIGDEQTPPFVKNHDESITTIHTHEMEHHITSDIAYAIYKYYISTGDREFIKRYGYEMLFENARFWASRVQYNKRKDRYEIEGVIGPDEFHIGVKNNAFTNMMAKWNLLVANRLFNKEVKRDPILYKRLGKILNITSREVEKWKEIALKLSNTNRRDGIIEQFDGYFKLKRVLLKEKDEYGKYILPKWPKNIEQTQLIKQADVLMLIYLLEDEFDTLTIKRNFEFYIKRTLHKSSLSLPIHALIASRIGLSKVAYDFFDLSLRTDLDNIYGNTSEGIHMAAIGGTWQVIVFGFGGIKINEDGLYISPEMPGRWRSISFSFFWKKNLIKLKIDHYVLKIKVSSPYKRNVNIFVFNKPFSFKPEKTYTFKKDEFSHPRDSC